jgi:hypothetical protein
VWIVGPGLPRRDDMGQRSQRHGGTYTCRTPVYTDHTIPTSSLNRHLDILPGKIPLLSTFRMLLSALLERSDAGRKSQYVPQNSRNRQWYLSVAGLSCVVLGIGTSYQGTDNGLPPSDYDVSQPFRRTSTLSSLSSVLLHQNAWISLSLSTAW